MTEKSISAEELEQRYADASVSNALADEDALGVTYADIDTYVENTGLIPAEAQARIEHLWQIGHHKRHLPVIPQDTWWRQSR